MTHFLSRLALFLLFFALVCEVVFRWVLPARETPLVRQAPQSGLIQFDPQGPREGVFSSGRWAQQQSRWRINAQGWNHPDDYQVDAKRKQRVLAVTGDSQMEGFYVDASEHLIQQVADQAGPGYTGYSFSASGYKLGEYIAVADSLQRQGINPDVLILFINQGDFWRGVTNLGGRAGIAPRISIDSSGKGTLTAPGPLPVSRLRRTLRHSATARYLVFNANLNPFASGPAELAMNVVAVDPEARASEEPVYAQAFTFLVERIRAALPRTRLLFLIDADRKAIMAGDEPQPLATSALIGRECARLGCAHLDLTQAFLSAWRTSGAPLHFAHNVHWNAHAHGVAARSVHAVLMARAWLKEAP